MKKDFNYSPEAILAKYYMYKDINDINLFVEDMGKEYEYETIFKKMFNDDYTFEAIFCVGGKQKLKDTFNRLPPQEIDNAFFIADGDFDGFLDKESMINDQHFIYLKTYNIESYFINEVSTIQFTKCYLKLIDNETARKINFLFWKERIIQESKKLFLYYCYLKKYTMETNVSNNSYRFVDFKTGFIKNDEVIKFEKGLLNNYDNLEEKVEEIEESYVKINGDNFFNLICGKFLLDSLFSYIQSIIKKEVKCNIEKRVFRAYLINSFDIKKLDYVKHKILNSLHEQIAN